MNEENFLWQKDKFNEDLYKVFMESATDMMNICNSELNIIYVNPSTCKVLGYSQDELLGKHVSILFKPEEKEKRFNKKIHNELVKKGKLNYDTIWLTKSGKEIHGELKVVSQYDKNKNFSGSCGVFRDITKTKLAFQEITKSEERHRKLVELMPDAILIHCNGIVQFTNTAAVNLFKAKSVNDLIGRKIIDFVHPDYRKVVTNRINKIIDKDANAPLIEEKLLTLHGDVFDAEVTAIPIEINNRKCIQVVTRDIGYRKKAEKELKEIHEKNFRLIDNIQGMVYSCLNDRNWTMIYLSNEVENLTGYKKDELLKNNELSYNDIIYPDDREYVWNEVQKNVKVKNPYILEYRIVTKNNSLKWVWERGQGVFDEKGKLTLLEGLIIDITENKNSHEELKYLSSFVEQSSEGMAIADLDGTLTYVNKAWCNMHEYKYATDLIGKNLSISHSPKQIKDVIPFNKKVIEIGSYRGEIGHITKSGRSFPTLMVTTLLKDKKGNPYAYAAIAKDITEIKNAQKALKESEEKYRTLVECSPMCILIHSKGIIQYVNPAALKLFEIKNEEQIIGTPVINVVHPDDREKAIARIGKIIKDNIKAPPLEEKLVTQKGKLIFAEVSASSIFFNGEKSILVVAQDVTERHKAQEQLKLLNRSIEQSPVSVLITDKNGTIEYANDAFSKNSGYSKEEIIGENPRIINSSHQSKELYEELWQTILSGKTWKGELLNKSKSGELYWENIIITPVNNKAGEITHFVSVKENITEIKNMVKELIIAKERAERTEQNVKQQNEEYEALNEELMQTNEELIVAKKHAEESDRLKSAFLANVSHEIRTPMNGILGFTSLLRKKDITKSEQSEFIEIIERSGIRMLETINDIIDISKIESGQVYVDIKNVNLTDLLDEIHRFFIPEAKKKGLKLILEKSYSDKNDIILSDNRLLEGILTNLIKNAIKFTKKGKIVFGYEFTTHEIQFYVKDTGIGIAKEKQINIFNRFVQEEQGYKRQFEGSGLGLSISKAYVNMLEGRIWLNSEPFVGSEFYFAIPNISGKRIQDDISNKTRKVNKNNPRKLNILIADDEDTTFSYLTYLLEDHTNNIYRAVTGIEAVEIVKNTPDIDLVLMDIKMPEMDGYEATKKIREFNKDIFIVAQTAYAFSDDKARALNAGCNNYISKPIDKDNLISIINEHFSH